MVNTVQKKLTPRIEWTRKRESSLRQDSGGVDHVDTVRTVFQWLKNLLLAIIQATTRGISSITLTVQESERQGKNGRGNEDPQNNRKGLPFTYQVLV